MSAPATCLGVRGCDCARCVHRREQQRCYAQRRRDRAVAERNRGSTTCQKRHGPGICGGVLETRIVEFGRTTIVCPRCERTARGICLDCPAPVAGHVGKALRCATHARDAQRRAVRFSELRHHDERRTADKRKRDRERRRRDPKYLAKLEYKRAWRKANRDKVREQKRRSYERRREHVLAYLAAYREKHREHYRDIRNRKNHARAGERPEPACRECGATIAWDWQPRDRRTHPPSRCDQCAWPYELRDRNAKRAALVERARGEMAAGVPSRRRIRRPPGFQRPVRGVRTCPTPGCSTVITGRKKKCTNCKQREAEQARQVLAAHAGRGRRTDLVRSA